MAQHGHSAAQPAPVPVPAPRPPPRPAATLPPAAVHRPPPPPPRPAARRALPSQQAPPPATPLPEVTLRNPRPDAHRASNIYTTTPGAPAATATASASGASAAGRGKPGLECGRRGDAGLGKPISRQPAPLKAAAEDASESEPSLLRDSFVCPACGQCRCEACRTPRPLPQHLLCNQKCVLSAETCVDCVSCLCCVKALRYHCSASDSGSRDVDKPCSCAAGGGCARWSGLALLSAVLPCLCCYWPLRGGVKLVEACYQRSTSHGCRCPPDGLLPR